MPEDPEVNIATQPDDSTWPGVDNGTPEERFRKLASEEPKSETNHGPRGETGEFQVVSESSNPNYQLQDSKPDYNEPPRKDETYINPKLTNNPSLVAVPDTTHEYNPSEAQTLEISTDGNAPDEMRAINPPKQSVRPDLMNIIRGILGKSSDDETKGQ